MRAPHVLCLLDDVPERIAVVVGRVGAAPERHLGLTPQHRERGTQLVADVREEPDAQPVEIFEPAIGLLELRRALAHLLLEQLVLLQKLTPVDLGLLGHPIELIREERELIAAVHGDPVAEPTVADLGGAFGQTGDRLRQRATQEQHGPDAGKDRDHGGGDDRDQLAGKRCGLAIDAAHLGLLFGDG
jgi:hypothetical protein